MSADAFRKGLDSFNAAAKGRLTDAFTHATEEVERSVLYGSTLTGAPGQPVDEYELLPSWIPERVSETRWQLTTKAAHAQAIEDGQQGPYLSAKGKTVTPKPMTLQSHVGGFHSVKLTRAGWDRIVDEVTRPGA